MKRIIPICFLFIIYFFSFFTVYGQRDAIDYIIKNTSRANNNIKDFSSNINKVLKEGFYHKNDVVNFYGLTERFLGRRLSSDGLYYRDTDNLMHRNHGVRNFNSFFLDNDWVSDYCKKKSIPYLLCQVPERGMYGDELSKLIDCDCTTNYILKLKENVLSNGDLYCDVPKILKNEKFKSTDIFFKSDMHLTTLTEITELKEIVNLLKQKGIVFFESEKVLDFENPNLYEKTSRRFLGNLSSQYGKFYAGTDEFIYYLPKFETSMQRINKEGNSIKESGTFKTSMLNGLYEDKKNWKYFITDFLNWPEPYYEIHNNVTENGPNILVFIDSQSMRAVTYLSLMCSNITVLDPRYFNADNNYFDKIKNKSYDAVITFATFDLFRGLTYESEVYNKDGGGY